MLPPGCPELSEAGLFILPASPAASLAHQRAVLENVSQIKDGNAARYVQQQHLAQVPLGLQPTKLSRITETSKFKTSIFSSNLQLSSSDLSF